ncbi:MAG: hypothetical protein QOG48_657 [Verrucomicrobiota bacterium]|jgi:TolB-like protein/Tfp pilus assembly protein PilF
MPKNFLAELKRRNVYKVAITYAVVSWLVLQAASILFPTFEAPSWLMKALVAALALGFVFAASISWAFEMTPEGMKRTEDISPDEIQALPYWSKRKFAAVIAGIAIIAAGLLAFELLRGPRSTISSGANSKSIAVLPFENLSEEKGNAYFAEGIQDEILTRLAKIADLKVISRTSTQRFKSAPSDLRDIARQLGVMHIVEGSVQKAGDQVRVNVQLINALTDAHLWADTYDRRLIDIFSVESEIAKTIADTLQAKLTGSEKTAMAKTPTANTEAYELYLKKHSLWEKRTGDNIPKAIAFYQEAIARDPNYALAYAGLAQAYILLPFYGNADRFDAYLKAKDAAVKALSLDSNLAGAHAALGKVLFFSEIDLAGAMREYKRAIDLEPNDATAHHWLGNDSLAALGQFEEGIAEGKRSVELDPLSIVINVDLGETFYYAHRYDQAAKQMRKALAIDPSSFYAHYNNGIVLQLMGDVRGAIAEYEKAKQLGGDIPLVSALCASAKALAGDKNAALRMLRDFDELSKHREVVGYCRALLYLSLNNKDEAVRWLEQGLKERDGSNICWIKVDPLLDPLHGDSRFEALVQKVVRPKTQ